MNESASFHPLILGIGNSLRGDDGLGKAVVEDLVRTCKLSGTIQAVHQLTPELALLLAGASLGIIIDASREGEPGEIRVHSLSSAFRAHRVAETHATTPEDLAALTHALYSCCPPLVVISMTGADFGFGEQFSAVVEQKIPLVSQMVRTVCKLYASAEICFRG
jgi:hydrogenase maturation protease